jgi:hypothetical protein
MCFIGLEGKALQMAKEMMEEIGNRIFSLKQLLHKYERSFKEDSVRASVHRIPSRSLGIKAVFQDLGNN